MIDVTHALTVYLIPEIYIHIFTVIQGSFSNVCIRTSEVETEAMFWVRCLTVCIIKQVHSKATRRSIGCRKACTTHSMAHAQGWVTVTVVIVQQKRTHSILNPVHETVLWNIWRRSYKVNENLQWKTADHANPYFPHTCNNKGVPWSAVYNLLI